MGTHFSFWIILNMIPTFLYLALCRMCVSYILILLCWVPLFVCISSIPTFQEFLKSIQSTLNQLFFISINVILIFSFISLMWCAKIVYFETIPHCWSRFLLARVKEVFIDIIGFNFPVFSWGFLQLAASEMLFFSCFVVLKFVLFWN